MAIHFTAEQEECIRARDKDVLVSAAAGSGKTAVLVERIIGLITDPVHPVDIDRLLVVTFTNAAAAQMKERIAKAVSDRLSTDVENLHLKRQETLIHHAQITTIDSFCLYIIRNHFNEIGLDPAFRVADTGELKLMKQDLIRELFEERLAGEETREDFTLLLDTFGGTNLKQLEDLILKIHGFSESHPWPLEWLQKRYADYECPEGNPMNTPWGALCEAYLEERIQDLTEGIMEGIRLCEEPDGPYLYRTALESDLDSLKLLKKGNWDEKQSLLKEVKFLTLARGKMEEADPVKKDEVKKLRERVKKELKKLQKKYFSSVTGDLSKQMEEIAKLESILLDTVIDFSLRFSEKKRDKNVLDFSDMEHFALDILTEKEGEEWRPSAIAEDYACYFKEIMIDEYQDSNLVQEYLLKSISGEWRNRHNRFMVGDLKQSIYRFRMARPEIFLEKYERYRRKGEREQCISLHANFRSRHEVVDSVNDVFCQLMVPEIGKLAYTQEEALHAGAKYPESGTGDYTTELLLLEDSGKDLRRKEAQLVAARIRKMVGDFPVTDSVTGKLRPAAYKDMVVLLRTNTGWDEVFYRELTKAGIPAALTGKTGYYQSKEVQAILNFLRVLDNPLQDIPLYGVLTSLPGRFSKDEAVIIKKIGKVSLFENLTKVSSENNQLGQKAGDFLELLNRYRDKVPTTPIHELIREVLAETGFLYYFAALPGGNERVANIKMLINRARDFEKTSYFGLFHFIRYVEQLQKYEIEEGEGGTPDDERDVVKIMTIHKSKGLEFPICFVSGLHKTFNRQDIRQTVIMDMDLGIGLEYRNAEKRIRGEDLRRSVIAEKQELDQLGEELRILYVAMTRAKEKLLLTGVVKNREEEERAYGSLKKRESKGLPTWVFRQANSYLELLFAALAQPCKSIAVEVRRTEDAVQAGYEAAVESHMTRLELEEKLRRLCERIAKGEEGEEITAMRQRLSFRYGHENLKGLYSKTTVSELKMKAMEEMDEPAASLFREAEVLPVIPDFIERKEAVSGTARGTAYHRVLELMDFAASPNWESLRESMEKWKQAGILDEDYPTWISREKMEAFLSSALAARMQEAEKKHLLYKERPFVLGIPASLLNPEFPAEEKVLVQGIIDVYFEEEGELVLADYKTDRVKTGEELVLRYKEQMLYYKTALEQITGKRVKEQILYSFALGRAISIEETT